MTEVVTPPAADATPPAATPPAATPPAATPPAFDWAQNGFEGEDLGYIQNKQFGGPQDLLKAYRNLESFRGVDEKQLIKLPKEMTPDALKPIFRQLGAPETADGYKLPVPDGGDDSLVKVARDWFFEAGATTKQAEIIVSKLNEYVGQVEAAKVAENNAKAAEALATLKTEWGGAWDQNAALVDNAAKAFGMDADQLLALREAMGPAGAMKFLHAIGSKLGTDDSLPIGETKPGFAMTPQQAQAKLTALQADPEWSKKYMEGNAEARAESERLHKFAYGAA